VFNDIVAIILFNTVKQFKSDFEFTPRKPFEILGNFFLLAFASIGIGIISGFISSLIFKWCRFFTHSSITESAVIYILALVSYFIAELMELSGLISLLTCGVVMGHYTWYNLSP
jgi:NhaP-type Na+/H+ or K+/H+ antiporter